MTNTMKTGQINHHLTDALLMAYAAGTLPEAFSLVVASHLSMCDECRARAAEFEAVGGEIMAAAEEATLDEDSFARTLSLIANDDWAVEPEPLPRRSNGDIFPSPLQAYVNGDLDAVKWRKIGGGVSQAVLHFDDEANVRLLRIPGGVAVPDHGHGGTELTLVLQGAFRDEHDRFGVGDVEVANEDMTHTPVAAEGEDCICLIATDAPLQFSGLLPRIAQKVIRI